jgi:LacI family transcriptional regulator
MAQRPTIRDVAAEAGVSVATVNRVLNDTSKVREDTARKVADAAHRIGYHATNLIDHRLRADLADIRLGFVLQKENQTFYRVLSELIETTTRNATGFRGTPKIVFAQSQSPTEVAQLMLDLRGQCDVIAATAVNHPRISDATTKLRVAGIPTFALFSDFAQGERASYIGTNNLKIGRGAACMLSVAAKEGGKIAIFVGGHRWHGHELRETGFRSYFREYETRFRVLDTLVNLETRRLTYEATLDLLSRHPDIRGIYIAGGGMEGAIAALREEREPGEVALVVNELTEDSRTGLYDRYVTLVSETPLPRLCIKLIDLMGRAVMEPQEKPPSQVFLEPITHLPEFI